jgi:biopolymer transport protein ExbD
MFNRSLKGTTQTPELEMTPMIDIVFQLLAFFIMTFRITALEGDFNIQMPIQSNAPSELDPLDRPVVVTLRSGENRRLAGIRVDEQPEFTEADKFERLANEILKRAERNQDPAAQSELIVEFVIDYDLRYSETIAAVTAVTGRKLPSGQTQQLVDSIKFRDQGARMD